MNCKPLTSIDDKWWLWFIFMDSLDCFNLVLLLWLTSSILALLWATCDLTICWCDFEVAIPLKNLLSFKTLRNLFSLVAASPLDVVFLIDLLLHQWRKVWIYSLCDILFLDPSMHLCRLTCDRTYSMLWLWCTFDDLVEATQVCRILPRLNSSLRIHI